MTLKRIRASLQFLEEMEKDEDLRVIEDLCRRAMEGKSVLPPPCEHEPDLRFGPLETCLYTTPGIDQYRYDGGNLGKFVCKNCSVAFIAVYDLDYSESSDNNHVEKMINLRPIDQWEAPLPIDCPDCKGTGKQKEQTQVSYHDNKVREYKTSSCDTCTGYGKIDPKKLAEVLEERQKLDEVVTKVTG
jgi:hypothetical protein